MWSLRWTLNQHVGVVRLRTDLVPPHQSGHDTVGISLNISISRTGQDRARCQPSNGVIEW